MQVTVRWTADTEHTDGLHVTADRVFAVGCEFAAAYDARTGAELWNVEVGDTPGWTPTGIIDGAFVIGFEFDPWIALDPETGDSVQVPPEARLQPPASAFELPEGYTLESMKLRHGSTVLWTAAPRALSLPLPMVTRVANLTFINDFTEGLTVVDDVGEVLYKPDYLGSEYSETPAIAHGSMIGTITADGTIHLLDVSTRESSMLVEPTLNE